MLAIRNKQMSLFGSLSMEKFMVLLEREIKETYPGILPEVVSENEQGEPDLRQFIEEGIGISGRFSFYSEDCVSWFIFLMLSFVTRFEELDSANQDIRNLLLKDDLNEFDRMDLIQTMLEGR